MARYDENTFCNCTSDWTRDSFQKTTGHRLKCKYCYLFKWYDAYYEDMLYDLRSMNTIW